MNDLYQAKRWTDASGETHKIKHMTDLHRRNVCGWLRDHATKLHLEQWASWTRQGAPEELLDELDVADPVDWVRSTPLYQRMARGLDVDPQPRPAELVRALFEFKVGDTVYGFKVEP